MPFLQDSQVLVGPMDQAGLRAAIEGPAASAGLVVGDGLVEVLLSDLGLHPGPAGRQASGPAGDTSGPEATAEGAGEQVSSAGGSYEAGRLPLLAYALQQTWQRREGRRLTVAGYLASGGIDGAVAQAADDVYERLDPAGQDALRRVLLRLVTLGEGTPDTRRRVTRTELTDSDDSTRADLAQAVLDALIDARLVTADEDTVEITHETLLTAWPRLGEWLNSDREGLRIHHDLADAARAWQHDGRDASRLYRGTRLAVARDWAVPHGQDLNADERAFLAASQHDQLHTTRLRRAAVAALAVLAVLSATVAGVAIKLGTDAVTARDQAIANQVIAEAGQVTTTDPSIAAQLDLVANQISPTADSETPLLSTTTTPLSRLLTGPTNVEAVAYSPDGRILAAGGGDDKVWLWNVADPARPARLGKPLTGPASDVFTLAFSPDGRILAAGGGDDKVWLWNVADPANPVSLGRPLTGPPFFAWSVAFSPDGRILAATGGDDKVWRWNVADPARPAPLGKPLTGPADSVDSVAFSPDGQILAGGSVDEKVWLWNAADHRTSLGEPLTGPANVVESVAFSPDGRTLAAYSGDGTIRLWNLDIDNAIQRICATTDPLTPAQWKQYIPQLSYNPPCTRPGHYGLLAGQDRI